MTDLSWAAASILLLATPAVAADSFTVIHKTRNCGSFRVTAETEITEPANMFSQGIRQSVVLTNPLRHADSKLDLGQHLSPDPALAGRAGLDGLAYGWACIRSPAGREYLVVYMFCANEGATTCSTALDMPGSEWNLLYDDEGRPLVAHPGEMTKQEAGQIRALGLWHEFMEIDHMGKDNFVYE